MHSTIQPFDHCATIWYINTYNRLECGPFHIKNIGNDLKYSVPCNNSNNSKVCIIYSHSFSISMFNGSIHVREVKSYSFIYFVKFYCSLIQGGPGNCINRSILKSHRSCSAVLNTLPTEQKCDCTTEVRHDGRFPISVDRSLKTLMHAMNWRKKFGGLKAEIFVMSPKIWIKPRLWSEFSTFFMTI